MPEPSDPRSATPPSPRVWSRLVAIRGTLAALVVFAASAAWFGVDLDREPHFVDESAYIAQSYYADLYFKGDGNNPAWLTYPAYDLPPLPKYLIGGILRAAGFAATNPTDTQKWYENTSYRPESAAELWWARLPSVLLGALGCLSLYAFATRAARDRRVGVLAAACLAINPLYAMHARRAMSDVPAEAFILLTVAAGLASWDRLLAGKFGPRAWLEAALAGLAAGCAAASKLNGLLALIVLASWVGLAWVLPRVPLRRRCAVAAAALISAAVAASAFVALNPFMTARPGPQAGARRATLGAALLVERFRLLITHRLAVSRNQSEGFADDAVGTPIEKIKVVTVQGFGRFGLFGPRASNSVIRYDPRQDWGAAVWLPWTALGAAWALRRGHSQRSAGEPPTSWAALVYAAVALAVVTSYLPLAWDRYFLSIQAGSALLAAGCAVATCDWIVARAARPAPASAEAPP